MAPASIAAVPNTSLPGCGASVPQGEGCVVVQVVGGGGGASATYGTEDVRGSGADVVGQPYDVPGSPGVKVDRGTSVGALVERTLQADGIDPGGVGFVEVDGPDDFGRHVLPEWRTAGGSGNAPVLYALSTNLAQMSFVRAPRNADDDLAGGSELGLFDSERGASLSVVVHLSGTALSPTVTATPVPGDDRSFTLTCTACGGGLTTTWVFPDHTTSTDPAPTFTFPSGFAPGSWPIAVAVEDPSDGSFGGAQTYVRIGAAPTPTPSAGATGSGGQGTGHHGATHGHGSSGTGTGTGHGHGTSGTASASPSVSASPSAGPGVAPTSAPSAASTPSAASAPSGSASAVPTHRPRPSATAGPSAVAPPVGSSVSGVLLADAEPIAAAPGTGPQVREVPDSAAAAAPVLDPPFRVDPLVWLGVGGVLLLGAGAASESEGLRRRARRVLARPLRRWARIGA